MDSDESYCYVSRITFATRGMRHCAIYVETGSHGSGQLLHVRCAIGKTGMAFERQHVSNGPESLASFVYKGPMGIVKIEDVDRLTEICSTIPTPATQYANYECQCGKWVTEALDAFRMAGVFV